MQADSILAALKIAQQSGTSFTTETLADFDLDGVDCERCHNTGTLLRHDPDGTTYASECPCMAQRRSLRRIKKSGLGDMLQRYTLAAYETPDEDRVKIKAKAQTFIKHPSAWLYIFGRSGSGKTHICTAICSEIMKNSEVYYMSWRDESTVLKSIVNEPEYEEKIRKLKQVPVLYMDDFLKGGCTQADLKLSFEIINARYCESKLRTIISSEMDIKEILNQDEALGGRIYERSRGFIIKAPSENWRLR